MVNVNGNAETIYYPVDDKDSTLIGVNKTESSFVVMFLKDKKVERILMTTATTGTMYPLLQLPEKDLYLKNFSWLDKQRPKKREDLFLVFPKTRKPIVGANIEGESTTELKAESKIKNDKLQSEVIEPPKQENEKAITKAKAKKKVKK